MSEPTLKEAGAGSLTVEEKERNSYAKCFANHERELAQLRTLAKDQGEALGECAKLFDVMDGVVWSEDSDFGPDNYRAAQEAINKALIAKSKEVGE